MDLFMTVMAAAKPYLSDPRLVPIPWTGLSGGGATLKPLKIGFMMGDGVIVPQPPVLKALEWAKAKLTGAAAADGFSVTTFTPYKVAEAMKNIRKAYYPDGGKTVKAHLAATGEPMLPLTQWIIKDAEGPDVTSAGVLEQRLVRDKFRGDFAKHWTAQDVDVVVCPVFVGPACEHESAFYWNYTAFWNYVDCPGVVIPTPIRAGKRGSEAYASADALGEQDKHVRELWAKGDFEGAPVNIQIVARKYHDNELFAALARMKSALEM
ncbi:acetamidase [Cordyceps militaris CM01]|uniref:Acetamidase n=1 Tax=Cordyceps militaris (strain CM01) TaxID=983644 RepID=G3JUY3_CORMM|nr:acetamidase [Cordyceps militaris CM01]EGX87714.1 acetamidase [Cordyceps militaris CM01]